MSTFQTSPPSILKAQNGQALDEFIEKLQIELSLYQLAEPLKKTGLTIRNLSNCLIVKAHGITLHSKSDHIWLNENTLTGRIQFLLAGNTDLEKNVFYTILIDNLGNIGHGELTHHFSSRFTGTDAAEIIETLRRVVTGLLNAIHELIPNENI